MAAAGSGSSRSTARTGPARPPPASGSASRTTTRASPRRPMATGSARRARARTPRRPSSDPLSADGTGPHGRPGQPRGVPHRPDVAVRRPARARDADAGRARLVAAPGRGGRDRAQHDGRVVRHRTAVDTAPPAVRPPARHGRPSPSAESSIADVSRARGAREGTAARPARLRSRHGARHDRPRARRAVGHRVHAAPTSTRRFALAHRQSLGLLGAHARRAGDPRRARSIQGRRRDDPRRPHDARRRPRPRVAQAPVGAERPQPRDGRRLVPERVLPARGDDRPAVRGLPGRGARHRGDVGVGESGIRIGIIGEIGRTSRGCRRPRSASTVPRRGRHAGRASRSRPTPSCPTSARRS